MCNKNTLLLGKFYKVQTLIKMEEQNFRAVSIVICNQTGKDNSLKAVFKLSCLYVVYRSWFSIIKLEEEMLAFLLF